MRDDIKEEAVEPGATNQLEPERSFMEFSRKIIDAIHGSNPNRMPAVMAANPSPSEGQSSSKKEQREVSTAQDSSYALGDFTSLELNTAHGNGQPGTAAEHDSSFVITDLNSSEVHTCQASLTSASKKRAAEGSDQSCRKYRKRPLCSRSRSKNSDDEEKFSRALEDDSTPSVKSSIKVFHCKYPGCKGKVLWRQGYGKNRLVMHTRLHWRKKTKKCCCCDFVATTEQKVRTHHNNAHTGKKFAGVISLESKADMEELLNLWKDCFPG
ncbi:hypothetical protein OESDEN_22289 [Oesophagostomum dentatum]|uniref:C2H2-type domain-containing protein n=1 Tax=Oesophagostomum dentatum TaxID=61180 RepID=A0A0B1S2I4_OESDE|nr:hypothetical protein OESDEN_22289 [Oesophagostomum dentatum]